jgi:hypothetical protein
LIVGAATLLSVIVGKPVLGPARAGPGKPGDPSFDWLRMRRLMVSLSNQDPRIRPEPVLVCAFGATRGAGPRMTGKRRGQGEGAREPNHPYANFSAKSIVLSQPMRSMFSSIQRSAAS